MRVAHVGPAALSVLHRRGGAIQRRMLELARRQHGRHEVVVYSPEDRDGSVSLDGVEVVLTRCRLRRPARDVEFLARVGRDLRRRGVDVVHFHGVPLGSLLTRAPGAKAVLSFDYLLFGGSSTRLGRRVYRTALDRFDALLPVSAFCRDQYLDIWGVAPERLRVVHNGVDVDRFSPDTDAGAAMRARLGLDGSVVVLSVGRVCEQKGTDLLVRAFPEVQRDHPGVALVVAGPAEQFGNQGGTALTAHIDEVGGRYLGAVDEDDLAALYNAGDVFAMPTREHEMFGMSAVEAQACGTPVVSSRLGGLVETVTDATGVFFTPGDAGDLRRALTEMVGDVERRERCATATRAHASTFSWDRIVDELDDVYGV